MIQRIQTIFLFLIAVAMGIVLSYPIWEKTGTRPTETAQLTALQYSFQQLTNPQGPPTTYITSLWYLAALGVLVAVLSFFTIFQYRKRLLQMGLCAVNALLLTAMMGIVLYNALYKGKAYGNPDDQGDFGIGFYALVAALVFNMFANRFIRRDEKLVRESNRFR